MYIADYYITMEALSSSGKDITRPSIILSHVRNTTVDIRPSPLADTVYPHPFTGDVTEVHLRSTTMKHKVVLVLTRLHFSVLVIELCCSLI